MPLVISGLESFDKLTTRMITGAREGMRDVGGIVVTAIQSNFDARGARGDRHEWEPVPVSWLAKRQTWPDSPAAQGAYIRDHNPLIDTGKLRGSFTYVSTETPDGDIEAGVQSSESYAEDHEKGIPGEIRQRSFMWITEEDYVLASAAAAEAVQEAIAQ